MSRSELITNVICPATTPAHTQFTFTFLISTPFPLVRIPAALSQQPCQLLRSGGCWWPLDPAVTQHTPPAPASSRVCTCLYACVWLSEWVCARQTVGTFFFLCFYWAGWMSCSFTLSVACNPDANVTAEKSLFKFEKCETDLAVGRGHTHKYILTPCPLNTHAHPASEVHACTYKAVLSSWNQVSVS